MSFDGEAELTAIKSRLSSLAGGRWYDGVPDDEELAFFSDGTVKPYGVITTGEPLAAARGRGLGVTEAGQPHVLPVSITCIANSAENARLLSVAVNKKLLGWRPSSPNSGELKGRGGNQWVTLNANLKPSRFHRIRYMECAINLSPASDPA